MKMLEHNTKSPKFIYYQFSFTIWITYLTMKTSRINEYIRKIKQLWLKTTEIFVFFFFNFL